jgi:ABC-type Fe3+/spermidine/putrescine transport system ATPase subunit
VALLELKGIVKTYQDRPALDRVDLSVEDGEILCLLGPSGSGKTTLLRVTAGLEVPERGSVYFEGRDMAGIEPHTRRFGMMFQEFALFPHKDVFENVAFGLRVRRADRTEVEARVAEMLALVGLEGFGRRKVGELSGGERQRVALARSLAPQPRLLMLDEPLGSLDRALRDRLMGEIRRILKEVGLAAVFVTHDQAEAFAVADRVAVIHRGRVEQAGPPEELYRRPNSAAVARFLGFTNLVPGETVGKDGVRTALGVLHPVTGAWAIGKKVLVLLRPEASRVLAEGGAGTAEETEIHGRVTARRFQGRFYRVELDTEAGPLSFDPPNDVRPPDPGRDVVLAVSASGMVLIPELSEED